MHSRKASFILLDRRLLAERWRVRDWYQPGRLTNIVALGLALARSDVVLGWFASWHTFWPVALAGILRKPSVLIVGGFDTASVREIGYGFQQGGMRRRLSRWLMHRATRLVTNSYSSLREIETNVRLGRDRVTVIHHGIPDPFGAADVTSGERRRMALTVAIVSEGNLHRKGLLPFVKAARELPDVTFVVAGDWQDDAIRTLRAEAGSNVVFTGWIPRDELNRYYREASVYVQASRHEGFGFAVAEAMLAGCIPVTTPHGALPEVVGDTGVEIPDSAPATVATGIARALELGVDDRRRCRERVLTEFTVDRRRERLGAVVEGLMG